MLLHFCIDTVSIVIAHGGPVFLEQPQELDFPTHGSLYVLQETVDFQLGSLDILCYNLENDDITDIIFTNPDLAESSRRISSNNPVRVVLSHFPPSFNGNVTCRSRATMKESTIFIASKYLNK